MHVLVTGGAGFIGSHVVEALLARGDSVTVLDAFDDAYDPAIKERNIAGTAATLVRGDVRDSALVCRLVADAEVVLHLAARAGVRESLTNPLLYQDVNVGGTAVVLDALRQNPGRRLVFASSSSVYGAADVGPFREDWPADTPASPYAATKRAGELLCHAAWSGWGLPVTCLRFFTVYGPRQRPAMAIARFVRHILDDRPIPVFGDGSSARDYTFVADAVQAILAALDRDLGYAVLNIGCSSPILLRDLVSEIGTACGLEPRIERLPDQPGDVPLTFSDSSRAREALGWSASTSLLAGLSRYVEWYQSQLRLIAADCRKNCTKYSAALAKAKKVAM